MASRRPASLKVRALQWLAQREHSPLELRAKLLRAAAGQPVPTVAGAGAGAEAVDPNDEDPDESPRLRAAAVAEVDALMAWLTEHRYLSTERFMESRVHARQARFGNQRITHELRQHGLSLAPETQQALRDSELSRARELWQRKYGEPATDAAGRLRQMRFLAGRGFSHGVVRQIVRGQTTPDDE